MPSPPAIVLKALPKLPFGSIRTDISLEYEELLPGYWKCSVYYRELSVLPYGIAPRSTLSAKMCILTRGGNSSADRKGLAPESTIDSAKRLAVTGTSTIPQLELLA